MLSSGITPIVYILASYNNIESHIQLSILKDQTLVILSSIPDINECELDYCSPDATCQNTQGSFSCSCNRGYHGDGRMCQGEKKQNNRKNVHVCLLQNNIPSFYTETDDGATLTHGKKVKNTNFRVQFMLPFLF